MTSTILANDSKPPRTPDWYPGWASELANLYFAANTCLFVIHGNVNDLVYCKSEDKDGEPVDRFCGLTDFLSEQVFGSWDVVTSYDMGRGIQAQAGPDSDRHRDMMSTLSKNIGSPTQWTRSPDDALENFNRMIQRSLLEDDAKERKRMAFLFPYAQFMVPAGDQSSVARSQAARLVRFLSWAQNPYIKRVNISFCLIAETLTEVNKRLVEDPHVAAIEVPLPNEKTRRLFIETNYDLDQESSEDADKAKEVGEAMSVDAVTQISNGLNLVNLNTAMSRSKLTGKGVDINAFRKLKKGLIERQCHGLVTFLEPGHTLDMVVGHDAAKDRLRLDARWIIEGRLDAAPMGYLICGPVGTGKTFISECYAGSIGIPCLVLKNFRSKYVGETEGNLEKVLNVLRSLGPVMVIIDEADAALGNREGGGDSGTSSRVFSMIASQMGNTRYRGKIIWMLLTSRPERLPIDLKRQGRAEVHIPLFYPKSKEEIRSMFEVMCRKNKVNLADGAIPDVSPDRELSGADIESVVLNAKREMMADDREELTAADLEMSLDSFIPSAQGMEKERQELCAVLECTDRRFLTDHWKEELAKPGGRAKLQQRVAMIETMLES
ncbi:AAA family ATPase [Mariniblastus sp.]|nr:AAA family ATPase [Mariniblastus sp.]